MSRRQKQLAPEQPEVIVFESYVSSHDDAMVHIDVQSEARLREFEAITRRLSTGELKTVRLSEVSDTRWISPLMDVVLTVSTRNPNIYTRPCDGQIVCEWTESTEGWLESAEKIAAMRASGRPCHQYFDGPHVDSLTIELAYLE
jgi:hypothetical protein